MLPGEEGYVDLLAALKNGKSGTIDGAWGSAAPLTCAALAHDVPATLLVVLAHVGDVDDFADDIATFFGKRPELFPAWERSPRESGGTAADELLAARLRTARRLAGALPPRIVVTTLQALMQPLPRRDLVEHASRRISISDVLDTGELGRWLLDAGFESAEVVEVPGEFSFRGGILDLFPTDAAEPLRIELFGDEVESIRPFDPETQRSLGRIDSVSLTAARGLDLDQPDALAALDAYLPADTWIALVEPGDLQEEARAYWERTAETRGLFPVDDAFARLNRFPSIALEALAPHRHETTCRLRVESVERFSGELARVKAELDDAAAGSERVLIACHNAGEIDRLREVFADSRLAQARRLFFDVGHVRAGFRLARAGLLVISDHELFDRAEVRRPATRRRYESRAIDSFLDLNVGDLVVHVSHGIARYRGLQLAPRNADQDHEEEQLVLEFAEGARLFVPVAQVDLVQKYVGGGRAAPPLSRIGSGAWEKRKKRVAEAVLDLASELIAIQAERASKPGFAYPAGDSRWMREFETSFPYQETPDQLSAIAAIKQDLAQTKPMDRLVCGDVGYGKTEVAMRAAFLAMESGKQVAVLVPTTVLAEQHHRTFTARMAEFPFTIEVINRFRSRAEVKEILRRTAEGQVDLLIGTHRLVQKDVLFKDLGLVIIDEEQRFGVEDKEWLKTLRSTVDVLTLSATPIPRTLHMSLLGIRDIANLETPPPDRKAIETRITRWDDDLIRRAILRELDREGQVYFVHNRVYDIQRIADHLQNLVPQARILIGHGQMHGDELERAMLAFVRHQADILVATTIIESGLDIPNVNTIFINEADRHGLADLHQLRGRVGRYKHRAYAYMIVDPSRALTPNAVRRLKAIEEFTSLGAGFKIALRDLEIRGAGNILGAEQSGHIEAVGYELYCSLLEAAVRALKGQAPALTVDCAIELAWRAYLPRDYVPSPKLKVELYRRLGRIRTLDSLGDFQTELADRFGPLPSPAANLIAEAELRIFAHRWQVRRIHVEDEFAVLTYRDRRRIETLARRFPGTVRIADEKTAYIPLDARRPPGAEVAAAVKPILQAK
jgi:transcription-repair coupling factor (superfamily II helicase)